MNPVQNFFNKPENYLHRKYGVLLRVELVSEFLGALKNKKILDAGCGDGSLSVKYLEGNHIVFCDVAENMLALVKKRIPEHLIDSAIFHNGPLEKYPSSSQFDVILCVGVLAHVNSVEYTIQRLSELLKRKGKLVIQFSDANHWLTRLQLKRAKHGYEANNIYYADLLNLCRKHGFVLKDEVRYHFLLPGMGKLSDEFLYSFQKWVMRTPFCNVLCSDYLWLMEKE